MKRISLALLSIAVLTGIPAAQAQDKYPSRPIKVEVPFGAGSATDIVIRIVGDQLRHELGQQIVVENKPGAFGILAIEEMVKARPDGYTLQVGNPGTNVLTPIIYKDKFKIDYDKEVVMVSRLGEVPLILAATNKDFAPKNYGEFIALAKANPGKVRYASVGVGSNNHYDTEAFAQWAGLKLIHIPNKGGGAAITNDLVSRRRAGCPGQRRQLGRRDQRRLAQGPRGHVGRAAAGISGRADAEGIGLRQRQGPVVGALCAR